MMTTRPNHEDSRTMFIKIRDVLLNVDHIQAIRFEGNMAVVFTTARGIAGHGQDGKIGLIGEDADLIRRHFQDSNSPPEDLDCYGRPIRNAPHTVPTIGEVIARTARICPRCEAVSTNTETWTVAGGRLASIERRCCRCGCNWKTTIQHRTN